MAEDGRKNDPTSASVGLRLESALCTCFSESIADQPRPLSRELTVTVALQAPPRAKASYARGWGGGEVEEPGSWGSSGPPGDFYISSGLGSPALSRQLCNRAGVFFFFG